MGVIVNPGEAGGTGSGAVTNSPSTENSDYANLNLREGPNLGVRPYGLTSRHLYNLRNQGWALPKPNFNGNDNPVDTISNFRSSTSSKAFPSNADTPGPYIYANTISENGSKYILRFNGEDAVNNPVGNSPSPIGYFIIDALDRGSSRKSAYAQLMSQYTANTWNIGDLQADETPGGPTVVSEYAGRVFYSGFPGSVTDGDTCSPKMSSYVLFSSLVTDSSSIYNCYQAGDPTSTTDSDLVDTDGGFIRIDGAYNIVALANIQTGLAVLAENGVWVIQGGDSSGFTATNYRVSKVTTAGCIAAYSPVVVDSALLYWSKDGIYNLTTNQYGNFSADNITRKTIQTLYNNISAEDQKTACGTYDEYEQKVKWIYQNRIDSEAPTVELVFDITLAAFSKYTIARLNTTRYPMLAQGLQVDPYAVQNSTEDVVDSSDNIVVDGEGNYVYVNTTVNDTLTNIREVQYLVILETSPITFTFGNYTNDDHYDWKSVDGTGIDASSYLLTGVLSGGDFQRRKGITYLTAHFTQTETGLIDDGTGSGDLTLANPSACTLQTQWDWTNLATSNRWSKEQQIYRLRRQYFPASVDDFDNGYYVVETRNKVRGQGKACSFLFKSSPGYHCDLLGWSVMLQVEQNV